MKTPLETVHAADVAFNEGNVEKILDCYDHSALLVIEPGKYANSIPEIKNFFESIIKYKFKATQIKTETLIADNIALFISRWLLTGVTADHKDYRQERIATCVFRKQEDGRWKLLIDNSYGPAILDVD
ncbi:MAG: hypothetical protein NTU49_00355 [Gammaproteobacteria bacterium]|nr:hypothetical protein [Gammaproteobacteria bacterium]